MRLLDMQISERAGSGGSDLSPTQLVHSVNLKLAALGCAPVESHSDEHFHEVARAILNVREEEDTAGDYAPVDARIQAYLDRMLGPGKVKLPAKTLVLDRPGLARALSIPFGGDDFASDILNSYKVRNGVLHNPKSDRRTTQGIFHIVEGGLPIPDDKMAVPKEVFARMFQLAFQPPANLARLPFTVQESKPAEVMVSLLLRPIVSPSVSRFTPYKTMEIRF